MVKIFLSFFLLISHAELHGVLFLSLETPPALRETLNEHPLKQKLQVLDYNESTVSYIKTAKINYLIDATFSLLYNKVLHTLASEEHFIIIWMGKSKWNQNEWRFYTHPPLESLTTALSNLVSFFDWESFHIVSSASSFSLDKAEHFRLESELESEFETVHILTSTMSENAVKNYLGRYIKPSGEWKFLIFNEENSMETILNSLNELKMMKKGCGIIQVFSGASEIEEGILLVVEEGLEQAKTYEEFELLSALNTVEILESFEADFQPGEISNEALRTKLEEHTEFRARKPNYNIFNTLENNNWTLIGKIYESKVEIQGDLLLPGGESEFSNSLIQLTFSQLSGIVDYNGEIDYETYVYFGGINTLLDLINKDDSLIPNFELVYNEVPCSPRVYIESWYSECINTVADFGLFNLHSALNEMLYVVPLFRKMNIDIFEISFFSYDEELYNKEAYPELVFINESRAIIYGILPSFLLMHGWENIIAIEVDNPATILHTPVFYDTCADLDIKIHNDEDKRIFIDDYTTEADFENYKHWFEHYYDTGVRVVMVLSGLDEYMYLVESFHKIGFRPGEIEFIAIFDYLMVKSTTADSDINNEIVESLIDGSLEISEAEYIDGFEESLEPLVAEAMAPLSTSATCFALDELQLGVYAVDTLMNAGRDYENREEVSESVREERIPGCTGTLSIDSSSNERRDMTYILGNIYKDPITGEIVRNNAGKYSAVENPLIQIDGEFVFYGGKTSPPDDMRIESWECNFLKEEVVVSEISENFALFWVIPGMGVVIFFLSGLVYYYMKKEESSMNSERNMMEMEDLGVFLSILVENVQFLTLGPDFSKYSQWTWNWALVVSLNLEEMYNWKYDSYLHGYSIYLILASVIIGIILVYFLQFLNWVGGEIRSVIEFLGEKIMPTLGSILFVPLIYGLIGILKCREAVGDELEDSFLDRDCNTFCWTGEHSDYSIIGVVILFTFTLLLSIYKSITIISLTGSSIEFSEFYLYLKTVLQITFVLLNFSIKERFPVVFEVSFSLILIFYVVFLSLKLVTNFEKVKMVLVFLAGAVAWSACLTTLYSLCLEEVMPGSIWESFLMIEIGGWTGLGLAWYFVERRYPPIFEKPKPRYNVTWLFNFMFGKVNWKNLTLVSPDLVYRMRSSFEPASMYPVMGSGIPLE